MLIINTREHDSLDRALKTFKKKFEKAGVVKQLRKRQAFTKQSVTRRFEVLKAVYVQGLRREEE